MLVLRHELLKSYIEISGLKQKAISEKTGIPRSAFCAILQGKRKCEVGGYARLNGSYETEGGQVFARVVAI